MARPYANPWAECFLRDGYDFEKRFLLYSLGYIVIGLVGNWCRSSYHAALRADPKNPLDERSLKSLVASRPTVIAATIHSISTAAVAFAILILYHKNLNDGSRENLSSPWIYGGVDLLGIWRHTGLPISISYFVLDCYFYCLPRKDILILVHHCIMCFCHYPVVTSAGALLSGAGDAEWVTWLSIVGYTSELSTAMMNYRWYLINTLEENWIGFGIVNGFVAISWAGRVVLFTYLLVAEILPRMPDYVEHGQMPTYAVIIFGHAAIGLLSLHWCIVMCRGGLKSLFVFKKRKPRILNPSQGFSFAAEVGGNSDGHTSPKKEKKEPAPFKIIEDEAEAYKDGTIFSDGQTKREPSKKVQ